MTNYGPSPAERQFQKYADEDWWSPDPDADDDDRADLPGADVNTWTNVVRRARLDRTTKYLALLLATYASPDGTSIYPGVARLAIQSRHGYRTVQRELARLRAIGLIERLPRTGLRRGWSAPYRLILGPDVLEKADVPSPATEEAAIEALAGRYRAKHRKQKTSRHPDGVQSDDLTPRGDTTSRHGQAADLQEMHATLHVPLPTPNPTSAESSVVARGTGSARPREPDAKPRFGSNPEEDNRRAELAKLEAWMRENAG